ncbi:hypothetical protein EVAR_81464_1 [Eumeta japonica]|uniref:Uncharacterized protein n=1 Tax=Eumeta variegata TaxID=151549 RepID=A0A4C1W0R2_EUMVA|nr:hypothetical protein EVAR_81464_1 [Eumeta japonica]
MRIGSAGASLKAGPVETTPSEDYQFEEVYEGGAERGRGRTRSAPCPGDRGRWRPQICGGPATKARGLDSLIWNKRIASEVAGLNLTQRLRPHA